MQVQVHTDNHITGREALVERVEAEVVESVGRFGDRITRVEVHIHDENGPKHGSDDKRCLMEARVAGLHPITASHTAASLDAAIEGAAEKLAHALDHALHKNGPKGGPSMAGDTQLL
jgi:ribosome-associated translation inhibitor RaiA